MRPQTGRGRDQEQVKAAKINALAIMGAALIGGVFGLLGGRCTADTGLSKEYAEARYVAGWHDGWDAAALCAKQLFPSDYQADQLANVRKAHKAVNAYVVAERSRRAKPAELKRLKFVADGATTRVVHYRDQYIEVTASHVTLDHEIDDLPKLQQKSDYETVAAVLARLLETMPRDLAVLRRHETELMAKCQEQAKKKAGVEPEKPRG